MDDCWFCDDAEQADADIDKLVKRFDLKVVNDPRHFLGMNVDVQSPTRIKLSMDAYVLGMADRYVPDWRSWPEVKLPCTDKLLVEYEKAHAREQPLDSKVLERFRAKVGALIYATPTVRVDACTAVGRLSRGQTFATAGLERCADETIVYLAQTSSLGLTFDGTVPNACEAHAQSDSDWAQWATRRQDGLFGWLALWWPTRASVRSASRCRPQRLSWWLHPRARSR